MSQEMNVLEEKEILELIEKLIGVADEIRERVESMNNGDRRKKVDGISNQYEIDILADKILHDHISNFPGYIISEERELDKSKIDSNELILVVDPIDGSTNASRKIGYWSFSAALVHRGSVIAGLVVDQVTQRKFVATQKDEVKVLDKDGKSTKLDGTHIERNEVGNRADNFSGSLIYFNSHEGPSIPFRHLRHFGSTALAICDVARGGLDAYIDDENILLKPWDLLAAEYIAIQAGCEVLRRDSNGILAATGVLVSRSKVLLDDFKKLFPHFF